LSGGAGPRQRAGSHLDNTEEFNEPGFPVATVETIKIAIENSWVADQYWCLSVSHTNALDTRPVFSGQCLCKFDGMWRTFSFSLFENILALKASVSLVTAYAQLSNYEKVIIGDSSKGIFVCLAGMPGSEVVMLFPLDSRNDQSAASTQLYKKLLCQLMAQKMK